MVLDALAAAPIDADTPQLLIAQAVAATQSHGGVVCASRGDRVVVLASEGYTPAERQACGPLRLGDLSLPLTHAATTGDPVWLASQADTARRFPRIAELVPRAERAYAALPLRAQDAVLGVIGIGFAERHAFTDADKNFLLALADICAVRLQQWNELSAPGKERTPAAVLGGLVQALSQAETASEVAQVIADQGGAATGAQFANIALLDAGAEPPVARLFHAPSLTEDVARGYPVIPVDESTSLGTALGSGGEVWLGSLPDIGARYPALLADTAAAGLAATASLALHGQHQRVIGAIGVAWSEEQRFTDVQMDEVRIVARLAADALRRALLLEAERTEHLRTERLQRMITALAGSASLAEVTAALFEHGLPSLGASAARLAIADPQQPGMLTTLSAVGIPDDLLAWWQALPPSVPSPSRDAIATSAPVYVATAEDLAARYPDASEMLIRSGHQAWIALPLRTGERMMGVLTLAFPVRRPLDERSDQIALTAMRSVVADALSRAIRHDRDRDLVTSVQRSLLADALPELPGVRLGARYMAAENHYGIGGDWYDAIPLPGGRILLIVGDVAGNGLDAAISMGQMRSAARALVPGHGPAALLDALDRFSCSTLDGLLATAAVAIIDPAERTIRYSLAGHLPLLLRRPDGEVISLDQAGSALLGLETSGRPEQVTSFAPGSVLVLFTDGLVERRDEIIDAGLGRLAAALGAAAPAGPVALCDALIRQSLPLTGRSDDTAILCAILGLARSG